MRVLAWNTSWNCGPDKIERQVDAVDALEVDVAFFSEWSPLPTRTTTSGKTIANNHHVRTAELDRVGLTHHVHDHASDYADRTDGVWTRQHWGVLGASRKPIRKVPTDNPTFAPGSWLEVESESSDLRLVGVRLPAWDGSDMSLRREFWQWMIEQFGRLRDTPTIALGDFNTETSYPSTRAARSHGADLLQSLTDDLGWTDVASATGQATPTFTRKNGRASRIDYAFASPALSTTPTAFAAPTTVGAHHLVGEKALSPLADHTPIIVEFEV